MRAARARAGWLAAPRPPSSAARSHANVRPHGTTERARVRVPVAARSEPDTSGGSLVNARLGVQYRGFPGSRRASRGPLAPSRPVLSWVVLPPATVTRESRGTGSARGRRCP